MQKADACSTTIPFLGLPASADRPEAEYLEPPRRSLRGYRCAYDSEPGSGSGLDEDTATPAERARSAGVALSSSRPEPEPGSLSQAHR